jgi:exodeoxyribonuclease V alpha subunit
MGRIVLKGTVMSATRKTEGESLHHVVRFSVTDNQGAAGIHNGDIIYARGNISPVFVREGVQLRLTGECVESASGRHLKIMKAAIEVDAQNAKSLVQYLSIGVIADINRITAERIVKHFGTNTLRALDAAPARIAEAAGVAGSAKRRIESSWKQHREKADSVIEAMSLGLSASTARRVVEHFGAAAADRLFANPYLLSFVQGYGYLRADHFSRVRGVGEDSDERIRAAAWYCLNGATMEGHSYLPIDELAKRVEKLTKVSGEMIRKVSLPEEVVTDGDKAYIHQLYEAERYVAQRIRTMSYEPPCWSMTTGQIRQILNSDRTLSSEQRLALEGVLTGPRLVAIMGLPGTGKTTLIRTLISVMNTKGLRILLSAPTGKAANRITEQTGHSAATIHRLLGYGRNGVAQRNEGSPLQTDCLVIDEASMLDINLMAQTLRALPEDAGLILVGDNNQLPSVGPGCVLREIRDKGLCNIVVLNQIHRQSERSMIVRLAHAIHGGTIPYDIFGGKDCVFIAEEDPLKIKDKVIELVVGNKDYPPDQIQVLAPMKRGMIGTGQLNIELKAKLRGFGLELVRSKGFAVGQPQANGESSQQLYDIGDRVIQKTNNYHKSVYNGEIGYVVQLYPAADGSGGTLTVLFDGGRTVEYEEHETFQLDLAYSLTVHRGQGSEYPCVIIPLHTSHYILLYRSLLYTAVTRARETVVIVGSQRAIAMAARNNKQDVRYANLSGVSL